MQASGFRKWIARLVQLDRSQRAQLLALLVPSVGLDRVCATIHGACRYRRRASQHQLSLAPPLSSFAQA